MPVTNPGLAHLYGLRRSTVLDARACDARAWDVRRDRYGGDAPLLGGGMLNTRDSRGTGYMLAIIGVAARCSRRAGVGMVGCLRIPASFVVER
jgi:hypothetical protein